MQLCFFEDQQLTNFHPLTLSRPLDDLRIGIFTLAEKWKRTLGAASFARTVRPALKKVFDSGTINTQQPCLWINARFLPSDALIREVTDLNEGTCLQSGSTVVAAKVDGTTSQQWLQKGEPDFNTLLVLQGKPFDSLRHLWDLFQSNGEQIAYDFELLTAAGQTEGNISEQATLENKDQIIVEQDAHIEAGCVLDARGGPIYIGKNATVMAGSILRGPLAVCKKSIVKTGAKIYGDTTIGPVCKVGGEVANTVFHSYSNKAHHGYIGNSVVGQWCNFGAGTTVSNLKTNYSTVRIPNWESGEEEDSDQQFAGIMMGDHSKTAINAVINSGTVTGVSCNILSRDFPPKLIHSFSWVGSNVIQPYKLNKALDTMETMMARRNVTLSEGYRTMMSHIFKNRPSN
jgi:UDP-N-acetylglucosamine diphosphorylase/glucosamine-1-phosphate N-acetyltransferase